MLHVGALSQSPKYTKMKRTGFLIHFTGWASLAIDALVVRSCSTQLLELRHEILTWRLEYQVLGIPSLYFFKINLRELMRL